MKRKPLSWSVGSLAKLPRRDSAAAYGAAAVLLSTAVIVKLAVDQLAGAPVAAAFAIWPVAIAGAAWVGGMRVGAVTAGLNVAIVWYFWIPPYDSFEIPGPALVELAVFGIVALLVALVAGALRLHIDQQESLLRERSLSARESVHRIRNVLAIVQGIATKVARNSHSFDDFKSVFRQRLVAISTAQEVLLRNQWEDVALGDLVTMALGPFLPNPSLKVVPGPPTVLQARLVQGLCLALHELAVNSVKYGALRGAGGEARINWKIRDGRCTLHWREDSVAAVAAPPGYGSSLVAGALPDEPDIGVRYSMGADGVHAVFSWRAPVVAPPLEQRAL